MLARERSAETGLSLSAEVPAPRRERRRQERQLTILRVGVLVIDGERELCLIRNISAGGLKAHVYRTLHPDQRLTVELKSGQQIGGRVVWTDGGNAGIAFDAAVDVAGLLSNPPRADGWRPRLPRVEIDRMGTLRAGADICWVQARDVSQGGVKLEIDRAIEPGAEVVITLEGLRPLAGTVRWRSDGMCGIGFNELLPFDELIAWLKR
jgi:hypothetical protein